MKRPETNRVVILCDGAGCREPIATFDADGDIEWLEPGLDAGDVRRDERHSHLCGCCRVEAARLGDDPIEECQHPRVRAFGARLICQDCGNFVEGVRDTLPCPPPEAVAAE